MNKMAAINDRPLNAAYLLTHREQGQSKRIRSATRELQKLAEDKAAVSDMEEIHCKLPNSVRATFLMAFSRDGTKVASTHGDHKIYICNVRTGKLLHTLEGHPRTPWCLTFHPSSNDILASGCLGGEVRVWDLHGGSEVWSADQSTVITSLAFHPLDKVLVISTFNQVHFWDWSQPLPFATCRTNSDKEKVRYVKFDPLGSRLITGISNLMPDSKRNSVLDTLLGHGTIRSNQSQNILSHRRRSILTRLMTMYRRLEGLEEDSTRSLSPTQEESLIQARDYAESTTHTARLQQQHSLESISREQLLNNPQPSTSGFQNSDRRVFNNNDDDDDEVEEPQNNANLQDNNLGSNLQDNHLGTHLQDNHLGTHLQDNHLGGTTRDFWATFQRLRSICSSLERTMEHHQQLQQTTESQVDNTSERSTETAAPNNAMIEDDEDEEVQDLISQEQTDNVNEPQQEAVSSRTDTENRQSASPPVTSDSSTTQSASQSLMSLLTRLQNSLQNAALTTAFAQEQIQQVRCRISEILERLTNVTGYRARLASLRDQIYEAAERTVQRGEENSPTQRWDLAHCLWLVEMSLQLTRQMQRILQADYRLTQLHLTSSTTSNSSSSSSSVAASLQSPLANRGAATNNQRDNGANQPQQPSTHLPRLNDSVLLSDFSSASFPNDRSQQNLNCRLENSVSSESDSERQTSSWHDNSPFFWRRHRPDLHQGNSVSRSNNLGRQCRERVPERNSVSPRERGDHSPFFSFRRNNSSQHVRSSFSRRLLRRLQNTDFTRGHNEMLLSQGPLDVYGLIDSNNQSYNRLNQNSSHSTANQDSLESSPETLENRVPLRRFFEVREMTAPTSSTPNSSFRIPEVQIESSSSPPPEDDQIPLPHNERPRSPPLSAILASNESGIQSWNRLPPYLSALYDSGFRPRLGALLGIHETTNNFTHRIQCWDFSRCQIPCISDEKKNVVARRCKIHNDASIDISSDGEMLAALVPAAAILANSAMLAIYSLNQQTLGQCLYTWGFEPNAISVSFSPLARYIVVGLASSRFYLSNAERETVAQILKLEVDGKCKFPLHVRSLTQLSGSGQQPQVSLNSVRWLPQAGQGLIYGTNRGCLCICQPIASVNNEKQVSSNSSNHESRETTQLTLGVQRENNNNNNPASTSTHQMLSTATQTIQPQTHTTGTQTPAPVNYSDRDAAPRNPS